MKIQGKNLFLASMCLLLAATQVGVISVSAASLKASIGGLTIRKEVKSVKDLKFRNIVRQTQDFSCGAAALATMLTYYMGRETSEEEVLKGILNHAQKADLEKIRKAGFSLLDLKQFIESIGYQAAGYRVPVESLEKVDRPAIALVQYKGYSHFVVVRGTMKEKVYIADPVLGNVERNLSEFSGMWGGILLFLADPKQAKQQDHLLSASYKVPKRTLLSNRATISAIGSFINPLEFH